MSDIYALLIGVDHYFPNDIGGGSYLSLGGCVRDVRHVEAFLRERLGVPVDHTDILTISSGPGGQPPEPAERWPTYENMVAAFKRLTERAQPGDQVYIHYSGHGGRAATAYAKLKGKAALDEALVPTDIGKSSARYLRDVELGYLLKAMVQKGLLVTVVLDSCHSGGATRGVGRAVKRGISQVDTTPRPAESLVASPDELAAAWGGAGGATRGAKPASGWLWEPQGYVLLAACRANEYATEYPFDGAESNGALTYWLLDSLRQAPAGCSYKMLYDRVLARVHSQFEEQTPQLQGDGDRALWGGATIAPRYVVPLLAVEPAKERVRLNAGEVQGVSEGAQFALYPPNAADLAQEGQRLALVEVDRVEEVTSWATIVEDYDRGEIDVDAQAVLLNTLQARLQRGVVVAIGDGALRKQVEAAIQRDGKGFVAVAGEGKVVDFQVAANEGGEYELWDPAGAAIPNLRPALRVDDPGALARLVGRLVHLAKYRNVQALDMPDAAARGKLQVTLQSAKAAKPSASFGEAPIYRPGDKVKLVVTNTQEPDPDDPNNPERVLNITILDLQADWGITQVYPAGSGAFEPLDPGQSIPLEFDTFLPEGYSESLDVLKVFATRESTVFRWLELPTLDQPDTRSRRTRGAIKDPLEQMLAQLTGEQAPTRAIRLTGAGKERGWTVGQLELRVKG